ncbi:hypothetical protein Z043_118129 [Scleropages formosus]|uniref:Family with sequence similarity 210 member Aa n=1 Tax=Scleropages formosus TaxID=113540 RepID=A0A0P7TQU5_SCLFO|nr:uncharacterized protein C18orf19 homolog A-like isoform X1 [Scleropages formosus]XP_018596967.1 uncharacterized protein C18orf19 homolog A-like isoform X1 [Scleropages formosus]KPP63595.1 hypothetical protein Z043_118129 [Scleropages formosus]
MQRILFHGAPQQAAVALRCALSVTTLSYVAPKPSKLSGTCSWTPSPRWLRTSAATKTAKRSKRGIDEEQQTAGNPGQDHGAQGASPGASPANSTNGDPLQDKSIGLTQRFKKTFKQYGKVMIPVHLLTSTIWFGAFYYTAMKGVNVVPFLEYVGFPEKLVSLMEKSQSGYAITAYAMFKMATPARYTVTLAGTSLSVKYLRRHGYMSTPPPVKEYLQDKMEETRERLSEKMGETKDKLSEKLQETKDKVSFRKKTE